MATLNALSETFILPVHPRARQVIKKLDYTLQDNVLLSEPVGYPNMMQLEKSARMILIDSDSIQKEAC